MSLPSLITGWRPSRIVTQPNGDYVASVLAPIMTDPCVIYDEGRYKFWYSTYEYNGGSLRLGIAYATGSSPITATQYAIPLDVLNDLVIKPSEAWDTSGCETICVVRDGANLVAYYTGRATNTYVIGRATSTDGITWTKRATPVMEGSLSWDTAVGGFGGCLEPSVCYDPVLAKWRMWYVGWNATDFSIGHATSSDGITWSKTATPVLTKGASGQWDDLVVSHVNVVRDPSDGWHMFYHGVKTTDYDGGVSFQKGKIGHAVSADGLRWVKSSFNPLVAPVLYSCGGPSAIIDDSVIRLWYFDAASDYQGFLRYIEAPALDDWWARRYVADNLKRPRRR